MGVMEAVVMEAEVMGVGVGVTAEVVIFKYLFHKIHNIKMFKIL